MDEVAAPGASRRPARRILYAAAAIQVALFALEARGTFAALLAREPVTAMDRLGPFSHGTDGMGYYAWLRSPLIDGDFQFDNEFAPSFARSPGTAGAFPRTATGHLPNFWSVGPAIAWLPAVASVHLALLALGERSPWPADGYSPPYQFAVGGTTLVLSLLTLELGYRIARRFARPAAAAAAAALVALGTPLVAYGTVQVSMAHGPAAAALALYAYFWLSTLGDARLVRWSGVGALLGLICLMRWQLATFGVLPAGEALWLVARAPGAAARAKVAARFAVALAAAGLTFAPQLAARQIVFGSPFGALHKTAHNWWNPSLWAVLFSTDRGFFYWTPTTLLASAGATAAAFGLAGRAQSFAAALLAVAAAVQAYAMAAILGGEVFLGWSFGFRFLTETCVVLVPGAAVLFDRSPRLGSALSAAAGALVCWNLLLLGVFRYNIDGVGGGDPIAVLEKVTWYVCLRPLEAVAIAAGGAWLTTAMVAAFRELRPAPAAARAGETRRLAA